MTHGFMGQNKQRAGGGDMIEEVVKIGRKLMTNEDIIRSKINLILFDGTEIDYNSENDKKGDYEVFFKRKNGGGNVIKNL